METSASFEARSAPSSYPTAAGNGGHSQGDPKSADRLFPYSAFIVFKVRIISGSSIELVGPCVDDQILVEVIHGSHEAILKFLFGCDADVAQHRTSELGEEPFDEIEPGRAWA